MGEVELTIVVPVLNRDESLRRAVATVFSQSDRLAVVIVDDGSAPDFAATADELAVTYGSLVQVVHQTNLGPAAARNAGLGIASSRFVMFLDSDDELAEGAFAAIERHLLQGDSIGMVSGAVRVVYPTGASKIDEPAALRAVPWARLNLVSGSFAVRTDIARAIGGYDATLRFGENTDFVLRLAEECHRRSLRVTATNEVLSIYYPAASDERRYDAHRLDAAIHLLRRGRFDLQFPRERAKLHGIAAVNAARLRRYRLSVRHAALAVLTEPLNIRHLVRLALSLSGPLARRCWLRT